MPKRVVIVGGGYGGCALARDLQKDMEVTLLERKNYFLHNNAAPRAITRPEWAHSVTIPYDKAFKSVNVVQAHVTKVDDKEVVTDQGNFEFDYCVVATGTAYAFPGKVAATDMREVLAFYSAVNDQIKASKGLCIIGGGPVGLEFLGNIVDVYPDLPVTLVHNQDKLVPGPWKDKFKADMQRKVEAFPNVKLVMGERVQLDKSMVDNLPEKYWVPEGGKAITDKGTEIECDMIFWAGGPKFNNEMLVDFFKDKLAPNGQLQAETTLQVPGFPHIFSMGDICAAGPMCLQQVALQHATVVAKNIRKHAKGKKLVNFKAGPVGCIIPLTTNPLPYGKGSSDLPFGWFGSKTTFNLKGRDLFTTAAWKSMGYPGIPAEVVLPESATKETSESLESMVINAVEDDEPDEHDEKGNTHDDLQNNFSESLHNEDE